MATLDDTLSSIVRIVLGDSADVMEENGPVGWVEDDVNVTWQVLGWTRQGVDERRYSEIGPAGTLQERIYGNRSMRVQFKCDTNAQTIENSADDIADRLVSGFMRSDVEEALASVDVGVPRCGIPRTIPYRDAHGDMRSVCVFEAAFPFSRRTQGGTVQRIDAVEFASEDTTPAVPPTTVTR